MKPLTKFIDTVKKVLIVKTHYISMFRYLLSLMELILDILPIQQHRIKIIMSFPVNGQMLKIR